jgi:hypothetical protein
MINVAAYPHPALRATFSRKREKEFFGRRETCMNVVEGRPLSRLRERAGASVSRCVRQLNK